MADAQMRDGRSARAVQGGAVGKGALDTDVSNSNQQICSNPTYIAGIDNHVVGSGTTYGRYKANM